ncbi:Hypothetical predicted protein [Octopus vulgaris]|uniref:Uncharacterized protein n=1 Tax=Octopus vulgaris TaxID=6645 RepID=A0AA36B284_OCTVU|nr:Hypothetical predicted protein [Octopus vulgaris]
MYIKIRRRTRLFNICHIVYNVVISVVFVDADNDIAVVINIIVIIRSNKYRRMSKDFQCFKSSSCDRKDFKHDNAVTPRNATLVLAEKRVENLQVATK